MMSSPGVSVLWKGSQGWTVVRNPRPGVILNTDAIPAQSVDSTADGAVLVLYSPAVPFTNCAGIALELQIAKELSGL